MAVQEARSAAFVGTCAFGAEVFRGGSRRFEATGIWLLILQASIHR
jgi:hypothetical protein